MRVAPSSDAGKMAEQPIAGILELQQREHAGTVSGFDQQRIADGARIAGIAAATSMIQICFEELDGSILDREVARTFARRVVRAFEDQVVRVSGRQS